MTTRLSLFVLVLVIASISLSQALRGTGPKKCCFKFTKPVQESKVRGYMLTHQQCPIAGVLLKMKNGFMCAKPSESWVQELMRRIDSRTNSSA
ncbi:chemokine (C-C motif) ligand 35, duplicate 1 [Boleophthalmus pectinirostris]|uniref:chemokine (C-C motif) ligand 35, duplicate 1 n=1 Tax=Boleophthalmus pectinirostris TaxID=150288 RepID=UPI000A1C2444|nr:chemokine (C-C motif) ligand 35, duplicate 1 [Boleophthalmus pectinirostris]